MFVPVPLGALVAYYFLQPAIDYIGMRYALWRRDKVLQFIAMLEPLHRDDQLRDSLRIVSRQQLPD